MNTFETPAQKEDIIRRAEIFDMPIVLELLRKNLAKNIPQEEKRTDVLYYEPTEEEFCKIIKDTGLYLDMRGETLKGYFMTMSRELSQSISFEAEMLEHAEKMIFKNKPIKDYHYVVLAQILIAKEFRGTSTFHKLHASVHSALKEQGFELGIGEILDTNSLSLAVHSDLQDVGSYIASSGLKWHIKVLDLRND